MKFFQTCLLAAILVVNGLTYQAIKDLRKPMPQPKPKQITSVPVTLPQGQSVVEICREGCGFCKKMQSVLKDEKVIRVDSKKYPELQGVPTPTYLVVDDGKIIRQWTGASDLQTFKERVNAV